MVDSDGTISTRIEGAFSVDELNQALDRPIGPTLQSSPLRRRISTPTLSSALGHPAVDAADRRHVR